MGGFGSGLYGNGEGKVAVERCYRIDIRQMAKHGALDAYAFNYNLGNDNRIRVINEREFLTLDYVVNGDHIKDTVYLEETKTGYGMRKWFLCPCCGDRKALLYFKNKRFKCRTCHNLNYTSSQCSGEIEYYHHQLMKLCRLLKAEYDPMRIYAPDKPKGMHWRTYEKYCRKYKALALKRDSQFIAMGQALLNRPLPKVR